MKRSLKIISLFFIFVFMLVSTREVVNLGRLISRGDYRIELGFYGLIVILLFYYVGIPLIRYSNRPRLKDIKLMNDGNAKAYKRLLKLHNKKVGKSEKVEKEEINKFILKELEGFEKIINKHAMSITTTVMISPNPFLDGLAVLLGNSQMIYELSNKLGLRYSWAELTNMYFSFIGMASTIGLIEEYGDEIEEILEAVVDEFLETVGEVTGADVAEKVPFLNVLTSFAKPLLQGSSTYAFFVYNGLRFKYKVSNMIVTEYEKESDINRAAKKTAFKSRRKYLAQVTKKLSGKVSPKNIKNLFNKKKESVESSE